MSSIRSRLVVSYLALAAITLIVTGALLFATTRYLGRQIERESVRQVAGRLLPVIQDYLRSESGPLELGEILRLAESVGDIEVRFVGPEGTVDLESLMAERMDGANVERMRMPPRRFPPPPAGLSRVMDRLASEDPATLLDGMRQMGRDGTFRVGEAGGIGTSYVEFVDRGNLAERVARLITIGFSISAAVTLAASALLGLFMSSRLTRPLADLTGTVESMSEGNLEARAQASGRDEIGTLGRSFNDMAGRLTESIRSLRDERDALRTFLADASHELRTPLTAMGTFVELMQTGRNESEQRELLEDLEGQISRMTRTVSGLLSLSRLDGGVASLSKTRVNLATLVREAWRSVSASGGADRIRFSVDTIATGRPEPVVFADRSQLVILFENVLKNSLDATGGKGRISCRIVGAEGAWQVRVIDDGPGVPAGELTRVFERFYRSPSNQSDGSGLGLAIVQAIAAAHGGAVEAHSPPAEHVGGGSTEEWPHGLEIVVTLPADEEPPEPDASSNA